MKRAAPGWLRHPIARLAAAALVLAAGAAPPALAFEDEVVPEGVVKQEIALSHEDQELAYNRFGKLHALNQYLIHRRSEREETTGAVTRTEDRADFRFTYGLTDKWNLFLAVPYLRLEQDSTLETQSSDPLVQTEVAAFRSQVLTGFGDFRLLSLHRPVFSDRNGFVWGYGIVHPVQDRSESRPGVMALALRSPNPSLTAVAHYTRYMTSLSRARFDLRGAVTAGLDGRVKDLEGKTRKFDSGNAVDAQGGWQKEWGDFAAGLELAQHMKSQNRLGGSQLHDPELETLYRLRVGYGNLVELEEQPLPFPYQVMLELERSLDGFNVPYSNRLTLSLQFYF